jgi:hypothetical protein
MEEYEIDYSYIDGYHDQLTEFFDQYDENPFLLALSEASYEERAKKETLKMEILDIDKFIKVNEIQEISNPAMYSSIGVPTSDGLMSNEIFGITQKDRSGTFGYINLHEYFLDPSCYKCLIRLDNKFNNIVKGIKKYKVDGDGSLVEDENGGTGLRWLKGNFGKIKFKRTDSRARDMRIRYIMHNYKLGRMWIDKYIVIPPYYRDANTSKKSTGVGQINSLYINLITASKAILDNDDYGLSMADTTCARMQDLLRAIYDWFCGNRNEMLQDAGTGLSGKTGIIRANMGYTSDYSSRLVICAPELKVETIDDLMVNIDKSAMPLAAVTADFYPFMIFYIRQFFENEFLNVTNYELVDTKGEVKTAEIENVMLAFNDDVIKDQLKKFVYSHDNRFIPIEVPVIGGEGVDLSKTYFMQFKYERWEDVENRSKGTNTEPAFARPLTWVDVIYMAAVASTRDKTVSITRFPYDKYFNTIYTKIEVASTAETEPLIVNGEYYRFYPKIRIDDIFKPSARKFVDVMQLSNVYLSGMGGDYDGDTIQAKGSFMKETNEEINQYINSKSNFVNLACENNRVSEKEAIQSMYNFTLVLSSDVQKLTNPVFE